MKIGNRSFTLVALVFGLALFLYFLWPSLANYQYLAGEALTFPYQIDYGEGPLLDQALRLTQGENIYQNDFARPPYTISNYPPVFLLLQAPFTWLFGPAFWYGRLISLVSALLAALFLGLTLHALTRDWLASLAGGLMLLAYPYVQFWSVLNRIDLLALALSWAAIYTTVRWGERRWGLILAAGLFVASIYTRQSYALAGPLGAFVWLLAMRRSREAFRLAVMAGGAGLALFLVGNVVTWGGFYLHIVAANVNPFSWETVWRYMDEFTANAMPLLILSGLFLVLSPIFRFSRAWPLAAAYGVAAALAALTVGKDGSNVNYMLEVAAASCFAAGAAFAWIGRNTLLRLALLAALAFQANQFHDWTLAGYNRRITEKTDQEAQMARLAQIVRETDGILILDEDMGLLPLAGKRLYFQPFEYKMLADGSLWDETPFLDAIREKQFGLIVQYDPVTWPAVVSRWTPRARAAVNSSYDMVEMIGSSRIYRPKE